MLTRDRNPDARGQTKIVALLLLLGLVVGTSAAVLGGVSNFAEDTVEDEAVGADVEFTEIAPPNEDEPTGVVATVNSVDEDINSIAIEAVDDGAEVTISSPVAGDSVELPEDGTLDAGEQIIANAIQPGNERTVSRHTLSEGGGEATTVTAVTGNDGGFSGNLDPETEDE